MQRLWTSIFRLIVEIWLANTHPLLSMVPGKTGELSLRLRFVRTSQVRSLLFCWALHSRSYLFGFSLNTIRIYRRWFLTPPYGKPIHPICLYHTILVKYIHRIKVRCSIFQFLLCTIPGTPLTPETRVQVAMCF